MKKLTSLVVVVVVVSACATSGGGFPETDAGKTGDSAMMMNPDTGTGAPDTGTGTKDSGTPDTFVDTCMKSPPSDVCGVFPQCDCGTNQTCEVDQTKLDGTSACVTAGTKTTGQACTATAGQCAPGLTCIWNECHPYCGTMGAACTDPLTNSCINLTDSSMSPIPNLLVCHINCALQDPNACGGGSEGCIYFDVDEVDCYPVGTSSTCSSSSSQCKPGDVCVYDGVSTYSCFPWCRIGMSDCISGTCNAFGTAPSVKGQDYGYCQ